MTTQDISLLPEPIALVVDDEPLMLLSHVDMLSEEGFAIVEATTAQQAYDFLRQHSSIQLLFTDVQTPGEIDGFELAKRVAEEWPHIAIVVASGAARPQPGDLPEGATFIDKPLSQETVHEAIKAHMLK